MELILCTFEKLFLAIILGGGIGLAANMRPIIMGELQELQKTPNNTVGPIIERISIGSWNRYNQSALLYTCLFFILQLIRLVAPLENSYFHLVGVTIMLIAWIRKLVVDKKLRARLENEQVTYVTDDTQRKGHKEVEMLSIGLLILALILFIYPV